jgi:ClpA/ClpB-like protein/UvrB/UvrC motif-containing protein
VDEYHWLPGQVPIWPVFWTGGQVLLSSARRQAMFKRFTDRARQVVVLAQVEARRLDHNYIGTEHILLGLIDEGGGVAAKALESLGIGLDAVRQQVEEIIGRGQQASSMHIPFTPRAKKVLELSLREALQLGHDYIGTEHILLGLIREGDGVAAQVLVRLGADPDRVRQQVIRLLHGYPAEEPGPGAEVRPEMAGQRAGTGPDTSDLDEQIEAARTEKEAAIEAQDFERAVLLRHRERQLRKAKAARQEQRAAGHPAKPDLAEQSRQLAAEVERLRALLRQHGIDPEDKPA